MLFSPMTREKTQKYNINVIRPHQITIIMQTRFMEEPVPSQKFERTCMCVMGVSSQEFERTCMCVMGVSSQEFERTCMCVMGVSNQEFERTCVMGIKFATVSPICTVTEYLCHRSPRIFFVYRNHNPVLISFMTYHRVCSKSNTTGATYGAGTDYRPGAPEFTPGFQWNTCWTILVF